MDEQLDTAAVLALVYGKVWPLVELGSILMLRLVYRGMAAKGISNANEPNDYATALQRLTRRYESDSTVRFNIAYVQSVRTPLHQIIKSVLINSTQSLG